MVFVRVIDTEAELFTWLVAYMQRGKRQSYPTPVVEFADLLIHKVRYGLDMQNLKDIYPNNNPPEQETVLAALFQEMSDSHAWSECSTRIISFAAALYKWLCVRFCPKRCYQGWSGKPDRNHEPSVGRTRVLRKEKIL